MVKCFHIWRSIMETLVIFITVDGVWASWGSYGACTVTCGGGTQERQRTCTNPAPQYGGANCPGSTVSSQACNTQNCPSEYDALSIFKKRHMYLWRYSMTWFCSFWSTVDGAWSSWGAYGTCSVTCGGGTQSRTRTCTNPTPQYGGAACPGTDTTSQDCNTQICISEFIAKGFLYDFQFALLICTKIKKALQPSYDKLVK